MRRARLYVILSAREVSLFLSPLSLFLSSSYKSLHHSPLYPALLLARLPWEPAEFTEVLSISRENCANARKRTRVAGYAKERADLLADSSLRSGLFRERKREKNRSVRSDKKEREKEMKEKRRIYRRDPRRSPKEERIVPRSVIRISR